MPLPKKPLLFAHAAVALALSAPQVAAAQVQGEREAHGLALFRDYVEPLFEQCCYACHSRQSPAPQGGLVLDSRAGWAKGGTRGPAVIPGEPGESLLLKAVLYDDDRLRMPPDGKLSEAEVAHLRQWIAAGAPDPRKGLADEEAIPEDGPKAEDLWSVQPLSQSEPPEPMDQRWPLSDVDRFILGRLETKDISPSADAAAHTLLRRLHYVLIGLPPSAYDADAFVAAAEKDLDAALAGKVDELLGSRHFGERWGRHWLDVARYADVTGGTQARAYMEAWRYRDYVIHSFNEDKPFDRFVREQLAGDLLPAATPAERAQNLIATGYLSLAHVLGADRDLETLKLDTINEQLDVIGTTFLGIRIGCARCHDHKLDPFPTRDYYSMAGIFRSTQAGPDERMGTGLRKPGMYPAVGDGAPVWMAGTSETQFHGAREAEEVRDEPIHPRGEVELTGEVVPRGFPTLIGMNSAPEIPAGSSGREQLAEWLLCAENPLVARVIVNRVWHHVFGQGIVRSADNFGFTGDPPSHSDLLDFLSRRLREKHAWSLKSMIRELLLTRTWRQASNVRADAFEIDPENRLLWRANLRRQEAEPLLDSIRAVVGTLDLLPPEGYEIPKFRTGNQGSTADLEIPAKTLRRRAVYWPVFRKDTPVAMDLLSIFNFPSPTAPRGARDAAAVPGQSLALLNSPLALDSAAALARSLTGAKDSERIEALYRRVLSRRPAAAESQRALRFLDAFGEEIAAEQEAEPPHARAVAWERLAHTLLVSNEFVVIQ